jgi:hypothetical protein
MRIGWALTTNEYASIMGRLDYNLFGKKTRSQMDDINNLDEI